MPASWSLRWSTVAPSGNVRENACPTASVTRLWELRHNVTPYDAAYVALAERLAAVLVNGDRRLAAAPGPRCAVHVLEV